MGIVSAGMHDTGFSTVPNGAHQTLEWHIGLFDDRQGIHVSTQCHTWSRLGPLQYANDPGVSDILLDVVKAEFAQMLCNEFPGAKFTIAQLRVGVQVAPPGDHLIIEAVGMLRNGGVARQKSIRGIHVLRSLGCGQLSHRTGGPPRLCVACRYN